MYIDSIVIKPRPLATWLMLGLLAAYAAVCVCIFVTLIDPSLNGLSQQHIAADSVTYIYFADTIREGRNDPFVYASLAFFPNTLWMPVFLAYILNSTVMAVVFNVAIFSLSILTIQRSVRVSTLKLIFLLLLNPTTTISLLSVNKEIIDLLVVALFCYFMATRRKSYLGAALIISLINRYEVFFVFVLFIALKSRINPWRRQRWVTLFMVLCGSSTLLPLIASRLLAAHIGESGEGIVAFLDGLEMHYLFILSALPKIGENLFGELLNPSRVAQYDPLDLANSYILLFNNLANAFVVFVLGLKGKLKRRAIQSERTYLALLASLLMSISLVIQPRYFYLVYVLLCVEAAVRYPAIGRNRRSTNLDVESVSYV